MYGILDFPLYEANSNIGYIPKPSQKGSFLNKSNWEFNSLSMIGGEFKPTNAIDILLIGDSIVLNGNRLARELHQESKLPIWPIAAGSWALRNELIYLNLHPEVVKNIDRFIFVLNSGDFNKASSWRCESTHPRNYPVSAIVYAFKRYVYNWETCDPTPQELVVTAGDWKREFKNFLSHSDLKDKTIDIFLYPNKKEISENTFQSILDIYGKEILKLEPTLNVFSVGKDNRWKIEFYSDEIHPTIEGTKILASIVNSPEQNLRIK